MKDFFKLNPKALKYGGTLFAFLLFVGITKLAQGSSTPAQPVDAAQMTTQVAIQAKQAGIEEGVESTIQGSPDALQSQLGALMSKSSELASADIDSLVKARGNAYLNASSKLANDKSINQEEWLRGQLKTENDSVKDLLVQYGKLSGEATQVNQITSHLINRAAILYSIESIGSPVDARIAPYDSSESINQLLYRSNQIAANRKNWATTEGE